MANRTEITVDISDGVLGTTLYRSVIRSDPCISVDSSIGGGNIEVVFTYTAAGIENPITVVRDTLDASFSYKFDTTGISGEKSGTSYVIDLFDASLAIAGRIYFDVSGIPGPITSIDDVTFRLLTFYPMNIYPVVYQVRGDDSTGLLHLTENAYISKEFIFKISLAQSFSNLKRSYRSIQAEKKFTNNEDYLRKLKTLKTRKNNCS